MPRHMLGTDQWDDGEILSLLDAAQTLKSGENRASKALDGRVLGSVFFNPSLRTRSSFEVGMFLHGGQMLTLEPGKGVWAFETRPGVVMDGAPAEHLVDAVRVLGRYVDALGVRAFPSADTWQQARRDEVLSLFAEHAGVSVINLESARRHPCQGLADAMTIRERFGAQCQGRKFVLAWAWHPKALPTAVPVSAAIAAARLGMEVTIARPEGYGLDPDDMAAVRTLAGRNGGIVTESADLAAAADGADVVYAKSWGSLECFGDAPKESLLRESLRSWQVDEKLMQNTRDGAGAFMHCLPVRRNVVVTDGVLDGPWSVVTDQAENRLHAQRALLLSLMGTTHE